MPHVPSIIAPPGVAPGGEAHAQLVLDVAMLCYSVSILLSFVWRDWSRGFSSAERFPDLFFVGWRDYPTKLNIYYYINAAQERARPKTGLQHARVAETASAA